MDWSLVERSENEPHNSEDQFMHDPNAACDDTDQESPPQVNEAGRGIVWEAVDSQKRGLQECEINSVANGSSRKPWDQVAIQIELLMNMYSMAPTAPTTGEPKKPPKAPAMEL